MVNTKKENESYYSHCIVLIFCLMNILWIHSKTPETSSESFMARSLRTQLFKFVSMFSAYLPIVISQDKTREKILHYLRVKCSFTLTNPEERTNKMHSWKHKNWNGRQSVYTPTNLEWVFFLHISRNMPVSLHCEFPLNSLTIIVIIAIIKKMK